MTWNPPASWYDRPEPVICCALAEDEEGHDSESCLAESAEAAAEARAERDREWDREMAWAEDHGEQRHPEDTR